MPLPESPTKSDIVLKILRAMVCVAMAVFAAAALARFAPSVFLFLAVAGFRLFVVCLFGAVVYLVVKPFETICSCRRQRLACSFRRTG